MSRHANDIINYREMCDREGASLQRGMNYRIGGDRSVFLMSVRNNAPYQDEISDDGKILIYEGHDEGRSEQCPEPKRVDQPRCTLNGLLTQNGKFHKAAQDYKNGASECEVVRVYEKIKSGIWSYNGCFHLLDSWVENDGNRNVFRFKLELVHDEHDSDVPEKQDYEDVLISRLIPSNIKLDVWRRDGGKCTECGASDDLHFDHIIPFSKGGSSKKIENVQLLCARHNLIKSDKII